MPFLLRWLTRSGIKYQFSSVSSLPTEIEHLAERTSNTVEGSLTDPFPTQPVILDEADNRSLISHSVIYVVLSCPRRDDQQRLTRAIATTTECVSILRIDPG